MAVERIAIVTGGNKGVGLAIVRQLALQYPASPSASGPLLIYLTARDKGRGETAVRELEADPQLRKANALASNGGHTTIKFAPLDISKDQSITNFAEFLKKVHPDGVDYVINNAGIAMHGYNLDIVNQTLHTNYNGTLSATLNFLPLLRQSGRLVNVASMAGHLTNYSSSIKSRFMNATSHAEITQLMQEFVESANAGEEKARGFKTAAYAVSKAGIIGMTRTVALELAQKRDERGLLVNSCCPGYVRTDMTGGGGVKSPDQGALTPVMLALADLGGRTGGFWQNEREIEW